MAFIDSRPLDLIDYTSEGGPMFRTDVVELESGHEQRNQIWTIARRKYSINKLMLGAQLDTVQQLFNAARGQLHAFRFKDWADYRTGSNYSSAAFDDEIIGTGDGVTTVFQIVKNYTTGGQTLARTLNKIVSSTTVAGVDGVEKTVGSEFSVNVSTGVITFTSAPASTAVVTAGCEFDVPVRFDTDYMTVFHSFYEGTDTSLPLVEVRI